MSKVIKVSNQVYTALDTLRGQRETFSEVVERLLKLHTTMVDVAKILGPAHYLNNVKRYQENVRETSHQGVK